MMSGPRERQVGQPVVCVYFIELHLSLKTAHEWVQILIVDQANLIWDFFPLTSCLWKLLARHPPVVVLPPSLHPLHVVVPSLQHHSIYQSPSLFLCLEDDQVLVHWGIAGLEHGHPAFLVHSSFLLLAFVSLLLLAYLAFLSSLLLLPNGIYSPDHHGIYQL